MPLTAKEAEKVREFAAQRGITEDEAATQLFQAGLAGAVTALTRPKARDRKSKVIKMHRPRKNK